MISGRLNWTRIQFNRKGHLDGNLEGGSRRSVRHTSGTGDGQGLVTGRKASQDGQDDRKTSCRRTGERQETRETTSGQEIN